MAAPSSELAARLRKRDAAAPGTRKLSHVEERDLRLRKRKEREAYVANMKELLDAEKDLQIKPDAVDFDVRSDTEIKLRWRLPGQDHYHRTLSKRAKFKKAKVAKLQAEIDQDPYKGKTIVYRVEYRKTDYSSWMWGGLFSAPRACDMRRTRQCFLQGLEPETTYSVRIGAAILPPWELRDDPKVLEEKEKETAELAAAAKAKGKAKGAGAGAGAAKKLAPQPKIRSIDEDDMDIDPELLPWTWSDMIPCPKPTMTSKEVQERLADRLRKREEKFETLAAETQNKIIAAQLERQEQEEQRAALEEEDRKKQLREAQQFLELQKEQAAMTVEQRFEQGKQRILQEEKRLTASMFSEESRKRLEERARKKKERMAAGKASGGAPTAPGDAPVDAAGAASGEAPAPIAASSAAPEGGAAEPASSGSGAGGGDDAPAAGEAGHTPSVSNNVIAVAVAEADEANARLSRRYTETQRVMSAATVQMNQAKDLAEKASEALRAATTVAAAGGADGDEAEDPTGPTAAGAASGSGSADTGALLKASDEATDRVVQLRTLRTCLVEELGVLSSAMQQMWNEPLGPSPADEAVLVDLGLPKEVARAVLLAVPAGEEAASSSGGWLGGLMGSSSSSGGGVSAARVEGVGKAVAALQEVKAYLKRARAGSADVGSGAAAGGAGGDSTPVPADHEDAKWKGVVPEVEVVLMGTSALGAALRNKKSVEEAVKAMQAEMRKRLQDVAVSSEAREMAKEEAGKSSSD